MKILAIGAHPDDIELLCGGTLLRAIKEKYTVRCVVCTNGESQGNGKERVKEQKEAWGFLRVNYGYFLDLKDGELTPGLELITKLDKIIKGYEPDLVFSHSEADYHQDHVAVSRAVRSANRNWNFNWLSYCSHDLRNPFVPNFFVNIDKYYDKKKELLKIFKTQEDKWYFKEDVLASRSLGTNVGKYVEPFKMEFGFMK